MFWHYSHNSAERNDKAGVSEGDRVGRRKKLVARFISKKEHWEVLWSFYPGKDSPHAGHRLFLVAVSAHSEHRVPPQCLHLIEVSDGSMFESQAAHFAMVSP